MLLPLLTPDDLARFSLGCQRPLAWASETERLKNLTAEHAFDLQLATDLDIATRRAEHFALGLPPAAYLNRWVTVSGDLQAMLSIRFRGLDVNQPFVDVSVTTRPVNENDFAALREAAKREYAAFNAPRLRFWSADGLGDFPETTPDMRALAAPLRDLRDQTVPEGLILTPTGDDQHYAEAQTAYAAVDARHPDHPGQASLLSREDLADVIEAGHMFDVLWNGVWSGYAGTLPEMKHGFPAQTVQELVLTPRARGHGLGSALSTLLARHLPDDGRVLYGTIHSENTGARAAALAAGRQDIGGWHWLPL